MVHTTKPQSVMVPLKVQIIPKPELVSQAVEVMANALESEDEAIRVMAAKSIIDLSLVSHP